MRGEPEELFRKTPATTANRLTISVEVLLPAEGTDQFGVSYKLRAQRLRYSIRLSVRGTERGRLSSIVVEEESCERIKKSEETSDFIKRLPSISYGGNIADFLVTARLGGHPAFRIRQDGPNKAGKPVTLPATGATRTALSTIATAEFPHLYALKQFLSFPQFLEINPEAARSENDRFQAKEMLPDASNLATVIARIKEESCSPKEPEGALTDISAALALLIPSVKQVRSVPSHDGKEFSYEIETTDGISFSSRVISDGTLRLLALISVLNDPLRRGLLCFEEPENGIHEGRVAQLIGLLRSSVDTSEDDYFQILMNTHSPAVMNALRENEIIAADVVSTRVSGAVERKTRMRAPVATGDLLSGDVLSQFELTKILHNRFDAA